MKVDFLNLKDINGRYKDEFLTCVENIFASGWYLRGKYTELFEREFASYCGVDHCVSVGSGLAALELILRAYGIGEGDEVIVPSHTYIATVLAVLAVDATPVFVEPDEFTFNINPDLIEAKINVRTKAIIPVHLYGQIAEMDKINEIAGKYGLISIEDAAQAHGAARTDGAITGSLSHAAGFSFYPGKNLGAIGDAGAVTTNDAKIAEKVRSLANYGSIAKYEHIYKGQNHRMDEIQAAFLHLKLKHLNKDNERRRILAERYREKVTNHKVILPEVKKRRESHVWHLFVVRTRDRKKLIHHLEESGIQTLIHYPKAIHNQVCMREYKDMNLPIAEMLADEVVSLPMSPLLDIDAVDYVSDILNRW